MHFFPNKDFYQNVSFIANKKQIKLSEGSIHNELVIFNLEDS